MIPPIKYAPAFPTGGECGNPRFLVELAERAERSGWKGTFLKDDAWYQGEAAIPTCDVFAFRRLSSTRCNRL